MFKLIFIIYNKMGIASFKYIMFRKNYICRKFYSKNRYFTYTDLIDENITNILRM